MGRRERLIDVGKLRAGDIILTRASGFDSFLLALFGRSRFSHAQIVFSVEDGGPRACEATTDLTSAGELVGLVRTVFLRDHFYKRATRPKSKRASFLRDYLSTLVPWRKKKLASTVLETYVSTKDIGEYAAFQVLRVGDQTTPAFVRFQQSLPKFCDEVHLKPYADVAELAKFAPLTPLWIALNRIVPIIPNHILPGLFCSQLVALAYKDGGLPLSDKEPSEITPRLLAGLAKQAKSAMITIPLAQLEFVPGNDYVRDHNFRPQNELFTQRISNNAHTFRLFESLDHQLAGLMARNSEVLRKMRKLD